MHKLASQNLFPLQSFVSVDPDEIRQQFPEFHLYATLSRVHAGERTHKEAGYVTEIATRVALDSGYNVLVDGSLRDWEWYAEYFKRLKKEYKKLRIAILYVSAPREVIFERAKVSAYSLNLDLLCVLLLELYPCKFIHRSGQSKLDERYRKRHLMKLSLRFQFQSINFHRWSIIFAKLTTPRIQEI
jgi:predicted kinase